MTVFDAGDISGGTSSSASFLISSVVNPQAPLSVALPFSQFAASGFNGPADFGNAGAITLFISGPNGAPAPPDVDLVLESVKTNGNCDLIPGIGGQVVDICGVCGGDGQSCVDCNGVPFGGASFDRCEICGGDGQSCLECRSSDISELLAAMDGGAKDHEKVIVKLLNRLLAAKNTASMKTYVSKVKARTHELQIRNWVLSWTIPRISTECANTSFCFNVTNGAYVDEYRSHEIELAKIAQAAAKKLSAISKKHRTDAERLRKAAAKVHSDNLARLLLVPLAQSVCT